MTNSLKHWKLLAAGLFMVFGRYPISWLLSTNRKVRKPGTLIPRSRGHVTCKSGNTWYVEIDGQENAQPIVLLHGLNASGQQWYYQRAYFKKNYKLIILDLPGHGKSPEPASMEIGTMANDLGDILGMLAIDNPIIYGHSLGGMVSMKYAASANLPAIKALIILQSPYTNPFKTCQFPKTMLALEHPLVRPYMALGKKYPLIFQALSKLNYLNGMSSIFYRYLLFSGEQTASQLRFMAKLAANNPPQVVAEGVLKILEYEISHELQNIDVPALIIGASYDRLVRPEAPEYIASQVRNGNYMEVGSGHLSLIEHPVEVNVVVNDFLESGILELNTDQSA
jgi:pimeloyl-ACP methyl ester carboxylesterase